MNLLPKKQSKEETIDRLKGPKSEESSIGIGRKDAGKEGDEDDLPFTVMSEEYYSSKTNLIVKHLPLELPEELLKKLLEQTAGTTEMELKYWRKANLNSLVDGSLIPFE